MRTLLLALVFALPAALAQSQPAGAGHWEGAIQLPDKQLKLAVDLAQNAKGEWIGDFDVPEQGLENAPLAGVSVKGSAVVFGIPTIPGGARFVGDLSPSGKALKGNFMQSGGSFVTELQWVSAPDVKLPPTSTAISKEVEGVWEGALAVPNGPSLRLRFKLASGPDGATGSLNSLDQGGQEIPFTSITEKDGKLALEVSTIRAKFTGELKNGELTGQWLQGPGALPLTLKRPAAK